MIGPRMYLCGIPELARVTDADDWPTPTKDDLPERYDAIQLRGVSVTSNSDRSLASSVA